MWAHLKAFLKPPAWEDEEAASVGYLLYIIIGVGTLTAVFLLLGFYISEQLHLFQVIVLSFFLLALLLAYLLLKQQRVRLASKLFLVIFLFLISWSIVFSGGLNATAYSTLLLLIFCTGLLLGRRAMLWFAAGVALVTIGLFVIDLMEIATPYRGSQTVFTRAITQFANLLTMTSLTYYSLGQIRAALEKARGSQQTLLLNNQQLQQEVKEREQVETALAHNNALLQAMFDAVPDGILVVNQAGQFVATNGRFRQMWGLPDHFNETASARAFVRNKLKDPNTLDRSVAASYAQPNVPGYMLIEMKDGTILESFFQPHKIDDTIVGRVWTYRDVTQLKQAEQVARASEQQFRELFELAPIGMAISDLNGRFLRANPAYTKTVGYSNDELKQLTFAQITHPDDLADNLSFYRQLISGTIPAYQYEKRYLRKDGTAVDVFVQVSPIRDSSGQPERLIAQVVDLTELRQAEKALQQAQKLESLGLMSGGIAHDFNNLLTAMITQVALAQAKLPSDSPAQRHIQRMAEAAQRAAKLTQQLLTFSGRVERQSHPLSLNILIQESLPLLQVAVPKAVQLENLLLPQLPLINGDEGQLQQVIMNLVLNAAEAMPEDQVGQIHLQTSLRTVDAHSSVQLYAGERLPPGDYVQFDVRDNGAGIDEATLAKVFDPFFTTKSSGHGLGLATVMGIVRSHDGGMQVSSVLGKGTRFRLFFPALETGSMAVAGKETAVSPLPTTATKPQTAVPSGCVLVIDDEAQVREAVVDVLAVDEIVVLTAVGGQSGLDLFQQRQDDIHLILLDISMPGLSGIETLARLRQCAPTIPVILSSGYSETDAVNEVLRQPHTYFLPKPYRWDELLAKIRPFLTT